MFELAIQRDTEKRLKIMDEILASGKHIPDREYFLNLVNKRRDKNEDPIKLDQFSKHVRTLKDLLLPHDVELLFSKSKGYFYSEPGFSLFKKELENKDKNLLMLASSVFGIFRGTPLQENFSGLIQQLLNDSYTSIPVIDPEQLKRVQIGSGTVYGGTKWILPLLNAITDRKSLEIQYINTKQKRSRKILCPYLLKQYNSRWYMVAYDYNCERPEKTNVFALEGIQYIYPASDPYYIDPKFNLDDYFKYCLGIWHNHQTKPERVQLEFSAHHEQILATPLHHTQKAELTNNGENLVVEIEVFITPELISQLLSYSGSIKIISPDTLVKKIKEVLLETVALY